MGSSGEEGELDGNSMISQTVAMAIAGTSTASPISRPSSFLLNSQVKSLFVSHHVYKCPEYIKAKINKLEAVVYVF